MQGQQPVAVTAGHLRGDGRQQHRRRAQALGEGRGEQHHRPPGRRRAQGGAGAAIVAEQRVQLGPAGLHHREVAQLPGQCLERHGGGRPLRAVQVEQAADPEVAAAIGALFHVEAVEQLHLGAADEGGHFIGGAEHGPRPQRHRPAHIHRPHRRRQDQARRPPGQQRVHPCPARVQSLGQGRQNGQAVTFGREQQVIRHRHSFATFLRSTTRQGRAVGVHYHVQRGRPDRRLPGLAGVLRRDRGGRFGLRR